MQEERISEKQLIIPALKIIKDLNGALKKVTNYYILNTKNMNTSIVEIFLLMNKLKQMKSY